MKEFFIVTNSFAAPFFSDTDKVFVKANNAKGALQKAKDQYKHPRGLYAANCYKDANAYHKGEEPLVIWRSIKAREEWEEKK